MKREIFLDGQQFNDIQSITVPDDGTVHDIVQEAAKIMGIPPESLRVFEEDAETPLPLDKSLKGKNDDEITHHVNQAERMTVTVNYQQYQKVKNFSPAARIQVILDWAVSADGFNIDAATAPEMELALTKNPAEEIPRAAHVGRYVHGPDHAVVFDLIRGVIANGALAWIR
ncbi:hypothetical protein [Noviherbaspirillum malthae]|jgi:hypothetical protein|uniref:hypothetical protein n=1 Tax=Noviherbaspirillum malthae TaxID=1260987 RepID=UPI00188EF15D|nr:hypothetical protein [Noviherbaspirillum malthae]